MTETGSPPSMPPEPPPLDPAAAFAETLQLEQRGKLLNAAPSEGLGAWDGVEVAARVGDAVPVALWVLARKATDAVPVPEPDDSGVIVFKGVAEPLGCGEGDSDCEADLEAVAVSAGDGDVDCVFVAVLLEVETAEAVRVSVTVVLCVDVPVKLATRVRLSVDEREPVPVADGVVTEDAVELHVADAAADAVPLDEYDGDCAWLGDARPDSEADVDEVPVVDGDAVADRDWSCVAEGVDAADGVGDAEALGDGR